MVNSNFWNDIYSKKSLQDVSWFADELATSKRLVSSLAPSKTSRIIDIGAGRSPLIDELLRSGYDAVTLFDISEEALEQTKNRLGNNACRIETLAGDITTYEFESKYYDLWHDRAAFHFLTDQSQRDAYKNAAKKALIRGGYVVIATFGPDGPTKCSGLEVNRYSSMQLAAELGDGFRLLGSKSEVHWTPSKTGQQFVYSWFKLL